MRHPAAGTTVMLKKPSGLRRCEIASHDRLDYPLELRWAWLLLGGDNPHWHSSLFKERKRAAPIENTGTLLRTAKMDGRRWKPAYKPSGRTIKQRYPRWTVQCDGSSCVAGLARRLPRLEAWRNGSNAASRKGRLETFADD